MLRSALLDCAQRQIVIGTQSHFLVPRSPYAIVLEVADHATAPGLPCFGVNVSFLEKEVFLCAKVEILHKCVSHFCSAAPVPAAYTFELVVHLIIATIEICEEIFEKSQLVQLLFLHEITESKSCSEGTSY